ncbi:M23 family metallopeptidase [Streptomyces sp. TRM70308]|uniref:M23 family metallopeptidase n=1 Tax=Streptomyces sp. TRM70308 TaxID=3131932 RepID=UPI003D054B13
MCGAHGERGRGGLSRRGVLRGGALGVLGAVPLLGVVAPRASGGTRRGGPPYARPLAGSHRISAAYGIPGDWLAGRHTGVDFAVDTGTEVHAVGTGTVDVAGEQGDYGETVVVRLADGHFALYAHLSAYDVKVGQRVTGGDRIARTGATGRVTGPHLHFEVRTGREYGTDVDPVQYLADRGVSVL